MKTSVVSSDHRHLNWKLNVSQKHKQCHEINSVLPPDQCQYPNGQNALDWNFNLKTVQLLTRDTRWRAM